MSANCDEYTPDPLTVRAIYATLGGAADTKAEKRGEAFDRMLAKVKAEAAAESRAEVGTRFAEWAAKNEVASPPLDWGWFGEIVRWTGSPAHEANVEGGDGS